ncbi:MAG: nickel pincer cofactor biosynthesis protein LarC [Gammaproteobacteria bacterium]|nr:nickel pincer cofactor biosynthesis protein LarC [Gammaproteobacteria bacterium]
MKALYYQCHAGISGDMHLGAMADLGVPEDHILDNLNRLPCAEEFEVTFRPDSKQGISGIRAQVRQCVKQPDHRHYSDIQALIRKAGFPQDVSDRALGIFDAIAIAEAKIHDVPVERVHFHEVGAVDSIVDVVAAAICLNYLDVDRVLCGTVEVGGGYVDCAHGRLPVPVPATQEILKGVPCSYGGVDGESTTPTGAAILKASVDRFETPANFTATALGYGIGSRDFAVPNVLRVLAGELETGALERARHLKIEANIDDMSPEAFEPLLDHLLELGADDVYLTPVVMKKSRPGTCLSVLCRLDVQEALIDAVLNRSTTIGLRVLPFVKHALPRENETVDTSFGPVRIKVITQPDGLVRWKSEFDDVRRIAESRGLDFLRTRAEIDREIAADRANSD